MVPCHTSVRRASGLVGVGDIGGRSHAPSSLIGDDTSVRYLGFPGILILAGSRSLIAEAPWCGYAGRKLHGIVGGCRLYPLSHPTLLW